MAREILMYMYPGKYPVLRQEDGKLIELDQSIGSDQNKVDFILKYYNKVGNTFEDKFIRIKEHSTDPRLSLKPMFWDHPEIKFVAREVE